jgi:hypothetical protein
MERTTVMLPNSLKVQAGRLARQRHISVGTLVRESLEDKINAFESKSDRDPFFADEHVYMGLSPAQLSLKHDDYLYGENT